MGKKQQQITRQEVGRQIDRRFGNLNRLQVGMLIGGAAAMLCVSSPPWIRDANPAVAIPLLLAPVVVGGFVHEQTRWKCQGLVNEYALQQSQHEGAAAITSMPRLPTDNFGTWQRSSNCFATASVEAGTFAMSMVADFPEVPVAVRTVIAAVSLGDFFLSAIATRTNEAANQAYAAAFQAQLDHIEGG